MADRERPPHAADAAGRAAEARSLAERGLHHQAIGQPEEAERLLAQAQELDPDTVAEVLLEHDAARAPDARLQDQADRDVEKVLPRIKPGPA